MQKEIRQALASCPPELQRAVEALPEASQRRMEELRLRIGREAAVTVGEREAPLAVTVKPEWVEAILSGATGHAVYSAQEMLKNGFVTLRGGHRLGICGTAVYQNGTLSTMKDISSLNLRIARELKGIGNRAADWLWTRPRSTLIIGPPGRGKTTLLRDLIFQLSQRFSHRVCVADERMELAAVVEGIPQFDLGPRTDVLSGVKKAQAVEMLLRTMNPQWIALDEITSEEDVNVMVRASYCGVRFLATAHAETPAELRQRPVYRSMVEAGVFENLIVILPDRTLQLERMISLD